MEIVYKHKQTGIKISHKDLKEKQLNINLGCVDDFGNLITGGTYKYYEIPFHDDFETICVTTEFTIDELELILYAVSGYYTKSNEVSDSTDKLGCKIVDMLNNKLKAR